MNKYQQVLMKSVYSYYSFKQDKKEVNANVKVLSDDGFTLTQKEDITLTDYKLSIKNSCIQEVYAIKNNVYSAFTINNDRETIFTYPISFEDKIDSVKIVYKNKLSYDQIIHVIYKQADKEKYYAKKAEDDKKALIASAQVKHSTGADLVNIYFQPCCGEYDHTGINLYRRDRINNRSVTEQLMGKYNIDKDMFFKSISGLAYGEYSYEVIQYDQAGKELMRTDKIIFYISNPDCGVCINC